MKKETSINHVINDITLKYLGKMGILGITNEGNKIILYSNLNKLEYNKIPDKYKGFQIYIRPSEKFSIQI